MCRSLYLPALRPTLLCICNNDPAPTEIYTLSLHDALPIWTDRHRAWHQVHEHPARPRRGPAPGCGRVSWLRLERWAGHQCLRSEEHTSELQSLAYLVCRLLLEIKNNRKWYTENTTVLQLYR